MESTDTSSLALAAAMLMSLEMPSYLKHYLHSSGSQMCCEKKLRDAY